MEQFTLLRKSILITGMRGSGKSVLCKYLVSLCKQEFDEIFVISTTEAQNGFYSSFINEKNIFTEFSSEWLSTFYKKLEEASSKKKLNVLLILDDCGSDPDFRKDRTIIKAFTRGRHIGLSIIILQQYLYQISPVCRGNCDFLLMGQSNNASIDILAKEYLMGDINKKDFVKLYRNSSCNHYFLVINCNSVKDNSDLDSIYGKIKVKNI